MATLSLPSTKAAGPEKLRAFLSRPVSTSSGSSGSSAADPREPTAAAAAAEGTAAKLDEGLGSLGAMATPRSTLLVPPTGLAIPESGPPPAGSEAARARGPPPPARVFAPYDDMYALVGLADGRPQSRAAAIAQMRRLAATTAGPGAGGRSGRSSIATVPLALAAPIGDLDEVEDALMAVIARRQIPIRVPTHCPPAGGAGSSAVPAAAAASPRSSRHPRLSMAVSMSLSAADDDRQSVRSHASIRSSSHAPSIASRPAPYVEPGSHADPRPTPYVELNGHMERLAACISRLQVASADAHAARAASMRTAGSVPSLQPPPPPHTHARKGSVASLHTSLPPNFDAGLRRPSLARLSPVSERPAVEPPLPLAGEGHHAAAHSRSSSHLSAVSGMSTESSRRRIMVSDVLTSAQYPNLFGSPLADPPPPPPALPTLPVLPAMPAAAGGAHAHRSPSAPSVHGESVCSHDSSETRGHPSPAAPQPEPGAGASDAPGTPPASASSRPPSKRGSAISDGGPLSITVRDITPASRIALWLQVHTTVDPPRSSLWRRKQWQRRFFIFTGNLIYLFKASAPTATALALVRLHPNTIVCVNDSFHNRSWVIEITHPTAVDADDRSLHSSMTHHQPQQSWFLQADTRVEMINLLKQLKGAVAGLQVRPDLERREEERLRDRRRRQRASAKTKSDVCPWEVDEFSDAAASDPAEDTATTAAASDGAAAATASAPVAAADCPPPLSAPSGYRIADYELFSDEDHGGGEGEDDEDDARPLALVRGGSAGRAVLERYTLGGRRPTRLQIGDYTGTGGIAEWGAHRMQVPYSPAGAQQAKVRSFSADPSAIAARRRPSLADAVAPVPPLPLPGADDPPAAAHRASPKAKPQIVRTLSLSPAAPASVRNSTLVRADAAALINQMFASASSQLAGVRDDDDAAAAAVPTGRNCLSIVCEED